MSTESLEKPKATRDRILDVAGPLFWREGFRAVGVDRVIADSGVAKATFYKHFPAKDDLIVAWLLQAEAMSLAYAPPEDGAAPLTAFAHALIDLAGRPQCLGCTWQGTAAEFADPDHPAHATGLAVKTRTLAALVRRATAQGLPDPQASAERVFLLLEGVWAATRMFGPLAAPLAHAKDAVARLT
jgi:AcrR family transcriptional regulator